MVAGRTLDAAWAPPLDAGLRAEARDAALLIGRRCTDPDLIRDCCALAREQTNYPVSVHWDATSIAQGDAGQAMLAGYLAVVDPDGPWSDAAARHAGTVAAALATGRRLPLGSVGGSAGVFFLARRLGDERLLEQLPELSARVAQDALQVAASIRGRTDGMSVGAFDLISGLSGVLLCSLPREREPIPPVVPFLVRALVALAEDAGEPPCWFTPPAHLYDDEQRHHYPYGNLNLGLAHGIPGPLAALAVAAGSGVGGEDAVRGVELLGGWLAAHATGGQDGPGWDTVVALDRIDDRLVERPAVAVGRDAWCYGTPGAARALFLAGTVAGRPDWCELSVAAMAAVYRRPVAARAIDSPTFCHGVAGLLQITLRFFADTGDPLFAAAATQLTRQILDAIDPARPLGVANLEPGDNLVDQPGLLDGAAGVSLVLAGAASEVTPTWDRIVGLA